MSVGCTRIIIIYYLYHNYKIWGARPPVMGWPREVIIITEIYSSLRENPIQTAALLPRPKSGAGRPNICFVHVPWGKHRVSENPSYIIHEAAVTMCRKSSKREHHIGSYAKFKVTRRAPTSHSGVTQATISNLRSDARRQCPKFQTLATSCGQIPKPILLGPGEKNVSLRKTSNRSRC
jgi:hypothetical protein